MRLVTKHIKKWFHLLLIVTMLGSLLPPAPLALASIAASHPTKLGLENDRHNTPPLSPQEVALPGPSWNDPPSQPLQGQVERVQPTVVEALTLAEPETRPNRGDAFNQKELQRPTEMGVAESSVQNSPATVTRPLGAAARSTTIVNFQTSIAPCQLYPQTYWYPVGNNFCDPASSTCSEGDGVPDGVFAGPWSIGYHQVEFSPHLVRTNTVVEAYWQTTAGVYGHLYIEVKLNGQWTQGLYTSLFQSTTGRWEPVNIGAYAGQYISGIRFGFSTSTAGHQFAVDGYRISNFDYCFSLLPDQTYAPNECPICGNEERQHFAGLPINTFTGNYNFQATDFSIAAVGQPLRLERTYNSLPVTGTVVYTRPLGYGWTHNHDLRLTFATNPGGEPGMIILKAPHGSRMRFSEVTTGTYQPAPGVWANLIRGGTSPSTYVYTVTAANQEIFTFNASGRLLTHRDPQGNATNYTYNSGQQLTRVTEAASGRFLSFTYTSGRLTRVTDNSGRQVNYTYAGEDLVSVRDTRNLVWTYTYSGTTHLLHTITDPDGKVMEKTFFESQGRATRQENGAGQAIVQISYTAASRMVTEMGRVITDTYNLFNLLERQTDTQGGQQNYTLDGAFNRTGLTDANSHLTRYERTPLGLTTAITDALNQRTRFTYDGRNNLTSVTDARNNVVNYTYDGQNNLRTLTTVSGTVVYTYNTRGQVTAMRDELNRLTQYGYDSVGNLTTITDTLGNRTRFAYDNLGRLTQLTDARNTVTTYQYDNGDNLTGVTANVKASCPAGEQCNLVTSYSYDSAGRLLSLTEPNNQVTRTEYDPAGRLLRLIQNYQNGIHEGGEAADRDVITTYEYDSASRLLSVIDPLGRKTRYEYDTLNRVRRVILNYQDGVYSAGVPDQDLITTYSYDAVGNLKSVTNNAGETTTFDYDELNRLLKIQNPKSKIEYRYDAVGNRTTLIDPNLIETRYSYDALNRLISVVESYQDGAFNPAIPDQDIITRFNYDPVGNLIQIQNPKSQIQNLQYDALNRLTALIDPLTLATRYGYDQVGNTTVITDAQSQISNLQYTPLNQLKTLNYPGTTPDATFSYDKVGNRLTMGDGLGTTNYTYDGLDRLTQVAPPVVGGQSSTVSYLYDLSGNRTRLTYPDTSQINYTYDALNRLSQAAVSGQPSAVVYSYNPAGRLAGLTRPNGINTVYGYDTAGRLTNLTHQKPTGVLASYGYTLDAAGNRTQIVETIPVCAHLTYLPIILKGSSGGGSFAPAPPSDNPTFESPVPLPDSANLQPSTFNLERFLSSFLPLIFGGGGGSDDDTGLISTFSSPIVGAQSLTESGCLPVTLTRTLAYSYDRLHRLTAASYPSAGLGQPAQSYAYAYDAAGNRTSQTINGVVTTYQYDAANRLTNVNGVAYSYDNNGNLLSDGVRTYTYDAANRLTQVVSGSVTTQFQYNGDGDRVSLTTGGVTTRYALDLAAGLPEVIVATTSGVSTRYVQVGGQLLAQNDGGVWSYVLPDGLGSVRQMVDPTGQIALLQNYDPFGNVLQQVGSASVFGYTGEQTDPTGLVFLRTRYYNPKVGRFLTPDTMIPDPLRSSGWNRYTYVGNNPIRHTDPSGHCFFTGIDTAACLTTVAIGLILTGVLLGVNASNPLPSGEAPSDAQGLLSLFLLSSGGVLGIAPEFIPLGGSLCATGCGKLRYLGNQLWQSTARLQYGPDPRFGNKVQHVLQHASDIPNRPGAHGVFGVGRSQILSVVDEAWCIAQRGGPGVTAIPQGARTVYIVDMGRQIGYVGGQVGAALGNPSASHIRLVIEGTNNVVTAYPVIP